MSDRNVQTIQQEYMATCAALGEVEYKVVQIKEELTKLNGEKNTAVQKLETLRKEYQAYLDTQKPAEAAVEAPAPQEAADAPVQS